MHGLDLSSLTAVVTGANSGIGRETARTLALQGASVVFACRTMAKAEAAARDVREERPRAKCIPMQIDLASLRSVAEFARELRTSQQRLDILILNAGVFGIPFRLTAEDGFEEMFQVNYLSQFYLADQLKELMSKSLKPKLIFVTAESHRFATLPPSPLAFATTSMDAYNQSKLLAIMFVLEANERWHKFGIRCLAVHPGNLVCTGLSRHWLPYRLLFTAVRPFAKSLQQATSSVVFAACAPEMADSGGVYVNNCFPCEPSQLAMDREERTKCWEVTIGLLKDRLGQNR